MKEDKIQQRREERMKRENLIRNYTIELDTKKRELEKHEAKERILENRIRFSEKTISDTEQEISDLKNKIDRLSLHLRQDKYETRRNKDEIMEIEKKTALLKNQINITEQKLKKAKLS